MAIVRVLMGVSEPVGIDWRPYSVSPLVWCRFLLVVP